MNLIKLKSGDTPTIRLALTDTAGAAVAITGYTIKFKISTNLDDTDAEALYMLTQTTFSDAANGIHDEVIPEDTTKDWEPGLYLYQARWIDAAGVVTSTDYGKCQVEENLIDDET